MKKTYIFTNGALAFMLLAGVPMVYAETEGPSEKIDGGPAKVHVRADMRTQGRDKTIASSTVNVRQKMENRRGEIEQKRNEMKNEMQGRMQGMMQKKGERVIHRLEAALERLNNIAGRIDLRITKLEAKGVNVTKAKADLAIAKTKIDAAKTKLDAAKASIKGILSDTGTVATSTPGSMISGKILLIREQVRGVMEALKEAHKALVVAITDLKGKSGDKTTTSTTTVSI